MQFLVKSPSSDHLSIYAKFLFDIGLTNLNIGNVLASNDSIPLVSYQWAKASDIDIEDSAVLLPSLFWCSCDSGQHNCTSNISNVPESVVYFTKI